MWGCKQTSPFLRVATLATGTAMLLVFHGMADCVAEGVIRRYSRTFSLQRQYFPRRNVETFGCFPVFSLMWTRFD